MNKLSRRKFLIAAAGLFATVAGRMLVRQIDLSNIDIATVRSQFAALGTTISIQVLHIDKHHAERAIAKAAEIARHIDNTMSLYRSESQVSRLNRDGFLKNPDPHLLAVLTSAQSMSAQSMGAFDVTVQPLWELYTHDLAPSDSDLALVHLLVDWRRLQVTQEQVWFDAPGMKLTLNGIAQGYATDCMMACLRAEGITDALVDGGEIGVLGESFMRQPWRIGIQHPRNPEALIGALTIPDGFLATSGDYQTAFTPDYKNNHIFDPLTGRSPSELASVTVIAPSATLADSLSTTAFVLGVERGLELIHTYSDCAAYCVCKDGTIAKSPQFPDFIS